MIQFNLTWFSAIVLVLVLVVLVIHCPWAYAATIAGILVIDSFLLFHIGKATVKPVKIDEQKELELLVRAEQTELIALSTSVELFPDMQRDLLELAARLYDEIGEHEKAKALRDGIQQNLI
jgi:hypothetical protein